MRLISNWASCRLIQGIIVLLNSNRPRASRLCDFEITRAITQDSIQLGPITITNHTVTDRTALHLVLLTRPLVPVMFIFPLLILSVVIEAPILKDYICNLDAY